MSERRESLNIHPQEKGPVETADFSDHLHGRQLKPLESNDVRMVESDQRALKRDLKGRHMQMIAIGGAIGAGLFIGSVSRRRELLQQPWKFHHGLLAKMVPSLSSLSVLISVIQSLGRRIPVWRPGVCLGWLHRRWLCDLPHDASFGRIDRHVPCQWYVAHIKLGVMRDKNLRTDSERF